MNTYYINVLLFPIILNILINKKWNHNITTKPYRILCECEIYTSIYDNDPEMQKLKEDFQRQTSERFKEYNERMQEKRKECKEQCDKDIQNLILKDKIEKQLKDKFTMLETDVDSDAIPTCVCEKSVADKTEKFCLNCSKNMVSIAPCLGLVCGVGYNAWTSYVAAQVLEACIKKGLEVGLFQVAEIIKQIMKSFPYKIPPIVVPDLMLAGNVSDGVTLPSVFKAFDTAIAGK
ncbi:rifin PIR protein, putative [Plasmodium gaboni]|uniref:Rifin PIR protein, putative n=1 Tax=Plasmodium gaboni TaxID=647221 RepID=A0ABY1UHZ5_9APIC|nr:rifin PIR protein, putative [Plasmodium gaboni]